MQPIDYQTLFKSVDHFKSGSYILAHEKGEINTPEHLHNKGQVIYAEHGTLNVEMEEVQYFLPVKHLIWIPPSTRHRFWSNNTHIDMLTIYFDSFNKKDAFFKSAGVYMINQLIHEMLRYMRKFEGHISKTQEIAAKITEAFISLLPEIGTSASIPLMAFVEPKNIRVSELMQYMRSHLNERLGMEEVSSRFGFSARSLSRLFNEKGTSYTEYLQSLRIVKSMELMAEKNMNVNLVAYEVGYESYSAFSKVFLRYTGIKPLEYIKKSKRDQ